MARIHILSDLHREHYRTGRVSEIGPQSVRDADVVVLAGDIDIGTRGIEWAARAFQNQAIVMIAGNHEFYGDTLEKTLDELRETAHRLSVHFLECDEVVCSGVRFLGTTLWTDMALHGDMTKACSVALGPRGMNDYKRIRVKSGGKYAKLHTNDTRAMHAASVRWLTESLSQPNSTLPTVVVTHHAPTPAVLTKPQSASEFAPCYASALDDLISRDKAALWIFGHTHIHFDAAVNGCRVVSNARGYPDDAQETARRLAEHLPPLQSNPMKRPLDCPFPPPDVPGFDPRFIVEVLRSN